MNRCHNVTMTVFVLTALLASANTWAAEGTSAGSDQSLIDSAMSAAPPAVGKNATIVNVEADGKMRTVREGNNGFTCMPDNPSTPGPDPMCGDKQAMVWADAWLSRKTPVAGKVGFMYMLAGGTDASNTDPYAKGPADNNSWIETGPHVMVVGADASFYDQYPTSATPNTAEPYVMWSGTPYQHLMVPVK